jgi:hypothetical protein
MLKSITGHWPRTHNNFSIRGFEATPEMGFTFVLTPTMNDRQFSLHSCESSVQMEDLRLAWADHLFCSARTFTSQIRFCTGLGHVPRASKSL